MKYIFLYTIIIFACISLIFSSYIKFIYDHEYQNCKIYNSSYIENSLNEKLINFNDNTGNQKTMYINSQEMSFIFGQIFTDKNICVNLKSKNLNISFNINYLIVQLNIQNISKAPFLKFNYIKLQGISIPEYYLDTYQLKLNQAWNNFFDENFLGRKITNIEIQNNLLVITGQI